jgi:phenylalanyl-tRNA synthetase beta chain
LPGNFKIKKSKLRGIESWGMICSASELGLEVEKSDGIMELPVDAKHGQDFRELMDLNDNIIEIDLTPNRGDCLSVAGVAREMGVLFQTPVTPVETPAVAASHNQVPEITLTASDACPSYAGRIIKGVNVKADTPVWMVEKLRRSGIRSLGPVVDVTNYVLLELGQPMHAFDLAKVCGAINVRLATAGEKLELLNGNTVELTDDCTVIADDQKAIAFAGVMGGANSEVGEDTQDILLESAFFATLSIAGRARRFGLHTDASHRYERGVDPQLQVKAIERATALLLAIAGGEAGPVNHVVEAGKLPARPAVLLRKHRLASVLGLSIDDSAVVEMLLRLDMQVEAADQGWLATPPSVRFDIEIEADLIEEVARIYGYDELPVNDALLPMQVRAVRESEVDARSVPDTLVKRGYQEVVTYSFVEQASQQALQPEFEAIALTNPISADMAVMRTSLWQGLLDTLVHNVNRQSKRARFFETGLRFRKVDGHTEQVQTLAGLVYGDVFAEQWSSEARRIDFFDVKADIEALARLTGTEFDYQTAENSALHPGQTAHISVNGKRVGCLGVLHPAQVKRLGLAHAPVMFEIEMAALSESQVPEFEQVSKFPAIRRDLALIVEKEMPAQKLCDIISQVDTKLIRNVLIFDVYQGAGIDSSQKSVALGIQIQGSDETLTDEVVEALMTKVTTALAGAGATVRE